MLALQIAAGIVLAAVVLRFWRQSLWVAVGLLALALLGIAFLWLTGPGGQSTEDVLIFAVGIVGAGVLREWRNRRSIRRP